MSGTDPAAILGYYRAFLASLKSQMAATKAGEAGFKVLPDGSFMNANTTIAESLKMLEDAITASCANRDEMPEGMEGGSESGSSRKVFTIGIACDADNNYNKDPKDPMKYEQEG